MLDHLPDPSTKAGGLLPPDHLCGNLCGWVWQVFKHHSVIAWLCRYSERSANPLVNLTPINVQVPNVSVPPDTFCFNLFQRKGFLYCLLKDFYGVIAPLLRLIRLLNFESDVQESIAQSKGRTTGMLKELRKDENMRKQFGLASKNTRRFDMFHIKMIRASLANDCGGPTTLSLQDLMVEVEQGKLVSILGACGTGKFSCLKLLTGLVKPQHGVVHVPTHLRCIYVPNVPELFNNGNLLQNLAFAGPQCPASGNANME